MNETTKKLHEVNEWIDEYLGKGKPQPTVATTTAAERNANILHVMFDTKTNNFVGASLNGKLFSGAVGAHLTKDGASLLNLDGENLLGAKAGVPEQRSQAAAPAQVADDILRYMSALSEGGDE